MKLTPSTLALTGALALPATAAAQTQPASSSPAHSITGLFRTTLSLANPAHGFRDGVVDAFGFQINYDLKLSPLWALQVENNTMFGGQGPVLPLSSSDYPNTPGFRRSSSGVTNTDWATRSRRVPIAVQGLLNVTCLWPLGDHWKLGIIGALGVNYAETEDTLVRHDVGSPARPGSSTHVDAHEQTGTANSYRTEIQFRAGLQARYSNGIFSARGETFYHVNPRLAGSGPDEGALWITRFSANLTPAAGPVQFPIDFRLSLAMQRDSDHTVFFNPGAELRVGLKILF